MKDKIEAALLGFAIGDGLGAPVEFFSKQTIHLRYGKIKDFKSGFLGIPYFLRGKGWTTDDTRLTLALIKGSLRTPYSIEGFHKEMNKQRFFPFLIGKNLLVAYMTHGSDWNKTSKRVHRVLKGKTAGNGALMRTLPIALLYENWEDVEKLTIQQAETTHMHELSTESCIVYNRIAYELLQGKDKKESVSIATKGTRYEQVDVSQMKPDGFCIHTLSWTIHWLLEANSYEEAVLAAVNNGGDTDTIAALVGGLAGIAHGLENIPEKWRKKVQSSRKIKKYALEIENFRKNQNRTI